MSKNYERRQRGGGREGGREEQNVRSDQQHNQSKMSGQTVQPKQNVRTYNSDHVTVYKYYLIIHVTVYKSRTGTQSHTFGCVC